MSTVTERLAAVRAQVAAAAQAAGRDPAEVTLVAVSKRQPDERLHEAYAAGQRDFGENYVQELERKRDLLPADARWHMIGPIQSNKAKRAATAHLVHTLDREKLARGLAKGAEAIPQGVRALLEVNIGREPQKAGVLPEAAGDLLRVASALPGVSVEGLMCIPPAGEGAQYFQALASLRDELAADLGRPLPTLSMGMSADFEAAIAAGATIVRVGTQIFGPRDV